MPISLALAKRILEIRREPLAVHEGAFLGSEIRQQVLAMMLSDQCMAARDGRVEQDKIGFAAAADHDPFVQHTMLPHRLPGQGNQARDLRH